MRRVLIPMALLCCLLLPVVAVRAALPLADLHAQAALSEQQGDAQRAERLWQRVVQVATQRGGPDDPLTRLYLAQARQALGLWALQSHDVSTARDHLQSLRAAGFSGAILASSLARKTRQPADLAIARAALARADESNPRVWLERARLAVLADEPIRVRELAARGVHVAEVCGRGDARTLRGLARVSGEAHLAVRALERALVVAGAHGLLVGQLRLELAWAAWSAGRTAQAWNLLQQVGAGSPGRMEREQGAALAVRMALAMPQEATADRRMRLRFAARLAPWLSQARSELRRLARGGMNESEP